MIIKGGSRAGPKQLARHLARTDTNEQVRVLEMQWGGDSLGAAFRDWQTLAAGTKGSKGLYHANIDPALGYHMTPDQWTRAVDVLEKELGLEGQPRAVVMHEKHGRQHIHVVWARTDIDSMKMRSDSQNFAAHERASLALEREFGHEQVPGKHAKRDRGAQPEPPRADFNHAEWQQAERAKADPRALKAEITDLFERSDTPQAFQAALADAGYILARGDKADFVIVGADGAAKNLGRQIGMKAAEVRAFMAEVDKAALPSAEQARDRQAARPRETPEAPPPEKEAKDQPSAAEQRKEAWLRTLERALTERHAFEAAEIRQRQRDELRQLKRVTREEISGHIDDIRAMQQAERDRWYRADKEQRSGLWGFINAVQSRLNPVAAAEKAKAREKAIDDMAARQKQERADLIALERQSRQLDIEDLKARHDQQRREHGAQYDIELQRYITEREAARELVRQMDEARRQREEAAREEQGFGRGPPRTQ